MQTDEARRRFSAARVARLTTVSATGRPHVVPCTFAVDDDLIYSAVDAKPKSTTNLQRLRNIRSNPNVAIIADHYEEDWSALWWVRADGRASVIDEAAAIEPPVRLLAERYSQYLATPPAGPVIVINVDRWTGWSSSRPGR